MRPTTATLITVATTTLPTSDPHRPPISGTGLTAVASFAACLRDSPHGTHSVGLNVELAEASLGRIFSRTKKNVVAYYYTVLVPETYVPSLLNTAQPCL